MKLSLSLFMVRGRRGAESGVPLQDRRDLITKLLEGKVLSEVPVSGEVSRQVYAPRRCVIDGYRRTDYQYSELLRVSYLDVLV
jgi:hypothetical protein